MIPLFLISSAVPDTAILGLHLRGDGYRVLPVGDVKYRPPGKPSLLVLFQKLN